MKYLHYLLYILSHKWRILRTAPHYGVPFWQALAHDWTRFLPSEFVPSAEYFYGRYQTVAHGYCWTRGECPAYDIARDLHEMRNKHHALYWKGAPIPRRYVLEMLCDWDAAGQAKGNPIKPWYAAHRDRLGLHPETLAQIDHQLNSNP